MTDYLTDEMVESAAGWIARRRALLDAMQARCDEHVDSMDGREDRWYMDLVNDSIRLIAAVEAVLDLHAPEALEVLASDCATEECDHWDECPTETFMVCRECYRVADETEPYVGKQRNVGPVAHTCPTVAAVRSALIGDDDE